MDKVIMGGIVRAGLASVGGYLVSKGYATSADVETLATNANAVVGVAAVVATVAWSWWSKRKAVRK